MSIGNGIKLSSGFDLNSSSPLDNRTVFVDVAERDSLPGINRYNGLICYVESTQANYQYIDGSWIELLSDVDKAYVDSGLVTKVDKVEGKGLSSNDFTTIEKDKLASLENYELPVASDTVLGGIKVGAGLTMTNGLLSATGDGGVADSVEWVNVQNKPLAFNPISHEHDSSEANYSNASDPSITSVKDALDKLLYFDLSIGLSSNISTLIEKGTTLDEVEFSWSYNKSVVSQMFDGIVLDDYIRAYIHMTPFSSNKTFTLRASDGVKSFSKSIGFNFLNGRYWGVSNSSVYDSSFILGLNKELSSSRNKTFSINCGLGQHIFYCFPSSFGTPTFTVGGFSGGFNKVSTIQFTNSSGFVESYDVWKSTNANLGNTTVVVS